MGKHVYGTDLTGDIWLRLPWANVCLELSFVHEVEVHLFPSIHEDEKLYMATNKFASQFVFSDSVCKRYPSCTSVHLQKDASAKKGPRLSFNDYQRVFAPSLRMRHHARATEIWRKSPSQTRRIWGNQPPGDRQPLCRSHTQARAYSEKIQISVNAGEHKC